MGSIINLDDDFHSVNNIREIEIASRTANELYNLLIDQISYPPEAFCSLTIYFFEDRRNKLIAEYFYYCIIIIELNFWHDFVSENPRVRRLAHVLEALFLQQFNSGLFKYSATPDLPASDISDDAYVNIDELQKCLHMYNNSFVIDHSVDLSKLNKHVNDIFLKRIEVYFAQRIKLEDDGKTDLTAFIAELDILKTELVDSTKKFRKEVNNSLQKFAVNLFHCIK